jgi:hypothetical protein
VAFCIPVSLSPGRSRLIFGFPSNSGAWLYKIIIPRWFMHINQNRILDSDMYLLHLEVIIEKRKLCSMVFLSIGPCTLPV